MVTSVRFCRCVSVSRDPQFKETARAHWLRIYCLPRYISLQVTDDQIYLHGVLLYAARSLVKRTIIPFKEIVY